MVIDSARLSFKQLMKRTRTIFIALHHAVMNGSVEDVHRVHLNQGYSGIGYHIYIRKDGSIWEGRPLDTVGAHAQGSNSISVGVCFEGNFEEEQMSDAQIQAGREVVAYLKDLYNISDVRGHREVNATACPGKNFPFNKIASATTEELRKESEDMYSADFPHLHMGDNSEEYAMLLWQTLLRGRGYGNVGLTRVWDDATYLATLDYKKGIKEIPEGSDNGDITATTWQSMICL